MTTIEACEKEYAAGNRDAAFHTLRRHALRLEEALAAVDECESDGYHACPMQFDTRVSPVLPGGTT